MVSTVKVTNIDTPDNTGNITFDRPIVGDGSGLTGVSGGKVLQVIEDIHTAREQTTSTTKAVIDTNWSVAITPAATSSRIIVEVYFEYAVSGTNGAGALMTLYRDTTDLAPGATHSYPQGLWFSGIHSFGDTGTPSTGNNQWQTGYLSYIDSPNTTSEVVYRPYWFWESGSSSVTWNIGLSNNTTENFSTLRATEIGA